MEAINILGALTQKAPNPSTRTGGDLSSRRRYCVVYQRDGSECASPWFSSALRATRAQAILGAKYQGAILYID